VDVDIRIWFVCRFWPSTSNKEFFVWFVSGKPITNPTKELDSHQKESSWPFLCSSNARQVVETLKGNTGLEATTNAGILHHFDAEHPNVMLFKYSTNHEVCFTAVNLSKRVNDRPKSTENAEVTILYCC